MRNLVWMAVCVLLFSQTTLADTIPSQSTFTISSSTIKDRANFPTENTCDGKDISPDIKWENAPKETASFALILSDLNAPGGVFYHWAVYNIPRTMSGISDFPLGISLAKNSWNRPVYNGPCPPKGLVHHYVFTLYALDSKLYLPSNAGSLDVLQHIQRHIILKTELSAVYNH
ncbi:MAG: YbhB/YbcL family Raf kinase inhibitor-like protein [Rickettsiales bacterium]